MKKLIKRILSFRLFKGSLRNKVYVFCYHDVSESDAAHFYEGYSTESSVFAAQIDFLKSYFEIIPISYLNSPEKLQKGKSYACITFDDGFYSVLQTAAPLLDKYKIPFSVFINDQAVFQNSLWCSDIVMMNEAQRLDFYQRYIDKSKVSSEDFESSPVLAAIEGLVYSSLTGKMVDYKEKIYMDIDDLLLLQSKWKAEIGYHTKSHKNLAMCSPGEIQDEVLTGYTDLKKLLFDKDASMFAIPFGKRQHYNDQVIKIIKEMGYRKILSTSLDYISVKDLASDVIPRIGLTNQTISEITFLINKGLIKKYNL